MGVFLIIEPVLLPFLFSSLLLLNDLRFFSFRVIKPTETVSFQSFGPHAVISVTRNNCGATILSLSKISSQRANLTPFRSFIL